MHIYHALFVSFLNCVARNVCVAIILWRFPFQCSVFPPNIYNRYNLRWSWTICNNKMLLWVLDILLPSTICLHFHRVWSNGVFLQMEWGPVSLTHSATAGPNTTPQFWSGESPVSFHLQKWPTGVKAQLIMFRKFDFYGVTLHLPINLSI